VNYQVRLRYWAKIWEHGIHNLGEQVSGLLGERRELVGGLLGLILEFPRPSLFEERLAKLSPCLGLFHDAGQEPQAMNATRIVCRLHGGSCFIKRDIGRLVLMPEAPLDE